MYVSSALTLGANPDGLIDEDFFWKPGPAVSGYALSKYGAEQEVWRGKEEGLPIVIVNPACVIGPSALSSEFTELLNYIRSGKRYFNEGINGYIGVWDLVESMTKLFDLQTTGIRFLLSSENIETKQLLQLISDQLTVKRDFKEIDEPYLKLVSLFDSIKRVVFGNFSGMTDQTILSNGTHFRAYDNQRIIRETELAFVPIKAVIAKTIDLQKRL
jgi:nucleoside-diphosphate-sugar epimerase